MQRLYENRFLLWTSGCDLLYSIWKIRGRNCCAAVGRHPLVFFYLFWFDCCWKSVWPRLGSNLYWKQQNEEVKAAVDPPALNLWPRLKREVCSFLHHFCQSTFHRNAIAWAMGRSISAARTLWCQWRMFHRPGVVTGDGPIGWCTHPMTDACSDRISVESLN